MPFGKLGIVTLAGIVAVGLGGFGAVLKGWSGSDDTVPVVTLADLDGRKDDGIDLLAAEDEDDRDDQGGKKAKKADKAKAKKQRASTNTDTGGGTVRAAPKASGGAAPAAPKPAPARDWSDDSYSGGGAST